MKGQFLDSYYTQNNDDFVDRLTKPNKMNSRSNIRKLQDEKYDKNTGQPLYHPKVGRPPLTKRDNDNMPVSEKLYMESKQRMMNIEQIKRQEQHKRDLSTNRKAQDKSEELVEQKKARKFHEIFMILDLDGDGIISAENIDISRLPPDILEIYTPLL